MAEIIEVGLKITGSDQAAKDVQKVDNATENLNTGIILATDSLDRMSGGAVSAFGKVLNGVKASIIGIKGFKAALASTGIGLLVIAVGSLSAYFTQTERGAQKLEVAMAGLKIAFAKITDVASSFGEKIVGVFNDPKEAVIGLWDTIKTYFIDKFNEVIKSVGLLGSAFVKLFNRDFSGALSDATQGAKGLFMELTPLGVAIETVGAIVENVTPALKEFVAEVNDAVDASTKLANRSIKLREDQRSLSKAFAEGRAQIKEYNLIAEDTTKGLDERIEAAQKAIDIEKGLMAERQRLAEEEVAIQKQNMALSESTEADKQKLVDLEVALINIRTESAEMQTTLNNKLNTMLTQDAAEKQARMDTFFADLEAQGKAEEAAKLKRLKDLKILEDREKAVAAAIRQARLGVVAAGFDALKSMAKTEEGQKKLAIAQVLVNQGMAMSNAIRGAQAAAAATGPAAPVMSPLLTAQMLAIVLGGFASIKGIMNQAGAATSGIGSGGGGGGGVTAPDFQLGLTPNFEELSQATSIPPVEAFVVQSKLADENAMVAQIRMGASL